MTVANKRVKLFDSQHAAINFVDDLAEYCKLYNAVTEQDSASYPSKVRRLADDKQGRHQMGATPSEEQEVSKLFCMLTLLETGVRSKGKAVQSRAAQRTHDTVYNAHMMPALVFLHVSKQVSGLSSGCSVHMESAVHKRSLLLQSFTCHWAFLLL